jgi:hypothetical protein
MRGRFCGFAVAVTRIAAGGLRDRTYNTVRTAGASTATARGYERAFLVPPSSLGLLGLALTTGFVFTHVMVQTGTSEL